MINRLSFISTFLFLNIEISRKFLKNTLLSLSALMLFSCSDTSSSRIYEENGIAMKGYDFVSYLEGKAVEGKPEIFTEHEGIKYLFTSDENKSYFEQNPNKYLPEYGGWCAYAILNGKKMQPDPTNFQIQDGKLFFFYSDFFTKLTGNLKDKWNESPKEHQEKADIQWNEKFK